MKRLKTLVLGGYGNFGARICRALAPNPAIELLIGGRDPEKAKALAQELGMGAQAVAADHTGEGFASLLERLGVELLIHTAGPFQQQAYSVARAAAKAGSHYIDLADGRRFVCDFSAALDADFKQAKRTAICGASTVPALSSAVLDHLCAAWRSVESIDMCIAPAQPAPRGKATLAGVLSYCGKAIEVWNGGRWESQLGWSRPQPVEFLRLKPRLGALCDVPDLELLQQRYSVTNRVMLRAAVELGFAQRSFAAIAALSAAGLIRNPSRLAGFMNAAAKPFDFFGSSLGAMVVRVHGIDAAGRAKRLAWHVAADHNHGPEIPCMAAIALANRLASGEQFAAGAFACMGFLTVRDFYPQFERWGMQVDEVDESAPHAA